ncbi:GGDEF domain-containing protein [Nautilia profundicola]|uniref:GGDEF domain-containing protein n=1 Tax=Nautilia profundicola TaxID=244787 RepID=UPI000673E162|nr:GGDEF domain-containing protein [Nautilia profundicola]
MFLAIIITFVFFVLRLLDIIPRPSLATLNTTSLLFFLIAMYVCLLKCKNKLYTIQLVTYFVIITFITLQTVIAKYNVFLPVWVDFTILTAYITTNKKIAIIISVYSLFALFFIKLFNLYNIDAFSFMTLIMSLVAFSILGFLISLQLDKYAKETLEQSKKLEKLALIDELTQIFNRRAFFKIAQKLLMQAKREEKTLTLIMMDIDHFKKINDTYGHKAGDIVLKSFVSEIQKIIRQNDLFARIGGEEFVLLLYDTSEKDVDAIVDKILNAIRNMHISINENTMIQITVSLGIYIIQSYNEDNIQQALINADKALYVAKKTGRNKAVYY